MKSLRISIICLLLFNFLTLHAQHEGGQKMNKPTGYQVGDVAVDFSLVNVDGNDVSLASLGDVNGYIVVFTSNVCPFALMYEDRLIELHNKMAPKGYPVVAINSNDPEIAEGDSYAAMQKRAEEKGFPFVYLKDSNEDVFPKFGATKTPHVFLLDRNMKVQYIGAIDDNAQEAEQVEVRFVENAIASIENGESPDPSKTKAIGCPIKSKNMASGGGRPGQGERRGPPSAEKLLEMMDANNDKMISKDEAKGRLAQDFDRVDTDENGLLSEKELSEIKPGGKGQRRSE